MDYIDRAPPQTSGDPNRDAAALADYLRYLYEQLNHVIKQMNDATRE